MKTYLYILIGALLLGAAQVNALPALQIGPGTADPEWSWDAGTQTWVYAGDSTTIDVFANATGADGGNGAYAWDLSPDPDQLAYLSIAAAPQTLVGDGDVFDVTVSGASLSSFGWGAPPLTDANSLAPHGVFDTYFEIYSFQFDGLIGEIGNVQPGEAGTGQGYMESIGVTFNGSTLLDFAGLHFDLFTMDSSGQVMSFAPFSHDAEMRVPEPGTLGLIIASFIILGVIRRRMISSV